MKKKKWWSEDLPNKTFTDEYGEGVVYTFFACGVWAMIAAIIALLMIFFSSL